MRAHFAPAAGVCAAVAVAAVLPARGGPVLAAEKASAAAAAASAAAPVYSLVATTRCLRARGARVERVRPIDSQLRQLRDLAQRTSREARLGKQSVGLAFTRNGTAAKILVELLTVPRNPYRLARRGNVVLMYRAASRAAFAAVVACLRS